MWFYPICRWICYCSHLYHNTGGSLFSESFIPSWEPLPPQLLSTLDLNRDGLRCSSTGLSMPPCVIYSFVVRHGQDENDLCSWSSWPLVDHVDTQDGGSLRGPAYKRMVPEDVAQTQGHAYWSISQRSCVDAPHSFILQNFTIPLEL